MLELVVLVLVAQVLVLDKVHKDSQGQEDQGQCMRKWVTQLVEVHLWAGDLKEDLDLDTLK
jgi:hypothetical protein